ncbi:MAG: thioesterase family protein [Bdellovibrionota bacterium]|nr:MAG: thioesterase family protein [Bdellovibrionota bacterium]
MDTPRTFQLTREITAEELQSTYQHVHHAKAICILEEGRYGFLDEIGYPFQGALDAGYLIVLTRLEVEYQREITAGSLVVTCGNPRVKGKLLRLHQQIFNHRGKLAVSADVELCFMAQSTRRGAPIPERFLECVRSWQGGDLT